MAYPPNDPAADGCLATHLQAPALAKAGRESFKGGENISSVEIEQALTSHPAVLEAAVVAATDEKWGEVPVAFVALEPNASATAAELTDQVRGQLARFKTSKRIVFGALPKTSTGKVQKNILRDRLKASA